MQVSWFNRLMDPPEIDIVPACSVSDIRHFEDHGFDFCFHIKVSIH